MTTNIITEIARTDAYELFFYSKRCRKTVMSSDIRLEKITIFSTMLQVGKYLFNRLYLPTQEKK